VQRKLGCIKLVPSATAADSSGIKKSGGVCTLRRGKEVEPVTAFSLLLGIPEGHTAAFSLRKAP